MDKIFDTLEYVERLIEIGEPLPPTARAVHFSSGGASEDVWTETPGKAIELWCFEFSKYAQTHKGVLRWGDKPTLLDKRFLSKNQGPYMTTHDFYCVSATFAIEQVNAEA